jgi:hypothetical protein
MQVSLRKAMALQTAINDTLKTLIFADKVSIDEFQNPSTIIPDAANKFMINMNRREQLLNALYFIRNATNEANFSSGINSRLSEIARVDKDIVFMQQYVNSKAKENENILEQRLNKIRNRKDDDGYFNSRSNIVETYVLAQDVIDSFSKAMSELKRLKIKLNDELLEANIRTTIELDESTEKTLLTEDII